MQVYEFYAIKKTRLVLLLLIRTRSVMLLEVIRFWCHLTLTASRQRFS